MNKKNIVGLIGGQDVCQEATNILQGFGFLRFDISTKVKDVAKYLLKLDDADINDSVIDQIRNRGYHVSPFYWINLTLAGVPVNRERIVIPDLRLDDVIDKVITPYYLGRAESCPPKVQLINEEKLKESLEKLFKPLPLTS